MRGWAMGLCLMLSAASGVSAQSAIEVPLAFETGRLVVPVDMGAGNTVDFVVSTSRPTTVISESLASHLDEGLRLSMGAVELSLDGVSTVPDSELVFAGRQLHGMVGVNTLSEYDVLLDAPKGRMLLKSIGRSVEWDEVALSSPTRMRVFHGTVVNFEVDVSGSTFGATLELASSDHYANGGLATAAGLAEGGAGSLTVGDGATRSQTFTIEELPIMERWDPNGNGFVILGAPLAQDCAIALSWVHQEIRTCAR